MKLLLFPLLFIANFAFANIPQIERIEGASRTAVIEGIHTAYFGMSPACDSITLDACNANPYDFVIFPQMRVVFKDDVTQIRLATWEGYSLHSQKDLGNNMMSVSLADLCNGGINASCSSIIGSRIIPLVAYVDANGNGLKDAMESAIAIHTKFLNPEPMMYGVWGNVNEGIGGTYGFTLYPSDGAIYLADIEAATNFPTLGYGSKVIKARAFVSDRGLESANLLEATKIVDLEVDPAGLGLIDNKIEGLQNGTAYVVRLVMLDEGGNMVLHFPAPGADATCDAGAPFTGCPWAATPEAVIGR